MFNLKDIYFAYPSGVIKKICEEIILQGLNQNNYKGMIGGTEEIPKNKNSRKKLNKIRNSNVSWLNYFWIYKELRPFVWASNQAANWRYDYDEVESFQFTIYNSKEKQHYDWHTDSGPRKNENGKIRKLSMTVALVDGSEYEGGDFEVNLNEPNKEAIHVIKPARLKGSVTIFPSFVWHRVTPVTSGTRYSLVNWHQGWPHT